MKQWIALILVAMIASSFIESNAFCRKTGLKGHVYLVAGNQMPSPDQPPAAPKGIQTNLYIFELTNISQVSREGMSAFYKGVSTRLVREVATNADGSFSVKLKPGWYSLFVKKGELFYSSQFDEKNNIHPVEVKSKQVAEVTFQANYDAVY